MHLLLSKFTPIYFNLPTKLIKKCKHPKIYSKMKKKIYEHCLWCLWHLECLEHCLLPAGGLEWSVWRVSVVIHVIGKHKVLWGQDQFWVKTIIMICTWILGFTLNILHGGFTWEKDSVQYKFQFQFPLTFLTNKIYLDGSIYCYKVQKTWNCPDSLAISKAWTIHLNNFLRTPFNSQFYLSFYFYFSHKTPSGLKFF